jgi:microcin C transport system substrate-binding protein
VISGRFVGREKLTNDLTNLLIYLIINPKPPAKECMPTRILTVRLVAVICLVASILGCNKAAEEPIDVRDNSAKFDAYYTQHHERFVISSLAELPQDLAWRDGSELTPFGDPRAKRGGRLTLRLANMQQTLRVVGPDANSTLRGPLWSANSVQLIEMHPWEDGYFPGVAREWAIDPDDGRTVYLRLDKDARWSDGKPFSVDDVFFSLYMLLSPDINDPAINRVFDESISRITRFDDETFSITFSKPSPEILYGVYTFILFQRDFYKEFGEDYVDRYHWRFAPVTGPYTLDESKVDRGRRITFDRIEDWWANDKPFYKHRFNPEKLTYVVVRDDSKAFDTFLNGDIDIHFLNRTALWYERSQAPPVEQGYIERAVVYNQLPAPRSGLYLNALKPLLADKNVRLGIQHATHYKKVNDGLYRSDRRRIRSFADGYGDYSHPSLVARQHDVEKSAEYFAAAGFTTRGSDGILTNDTGQRLSFVLTISNRGDDTAVATILKEEAQRAGLEFVIEALGPTAFFTKTFEKKHELAILGWDTGYSPLPAFEWEIRGEDAGKPNNFNTTNIKDEQLDAYLAEWDAVSDSARAEKISHEIQERIHNFGAWIPGLTTDYDRIGYWRWVRWPDYFQAPRYMFYTAPGVFWIDEGIQRETLEAKRDGRTFPPVTRTYDRWK